MKTSQPNLRPVPKRIVETLEACIDCIIPDMNQTQILENIQMHDDPQAFIDAVDDKYIVVTATLNDDDADSSGKWIFDNFDVEDMLVESGYLPYSHFELYFENCAYQVWVGRLV